MQNVEFKCELRDPDLAGAICRRIGAVHVASLVQQDTYYRATDGRLKKRESSGEPTEWIFYNRSNETRPRLSQFTIYSENEARDRFGAEPLPVWVIVRKRRDLWMKDAVRIHIDAVESLGWFLEFEAMVSRRNNVARCHAAIEELRRQFAPTTGEAISCGYGDLIAAESEPAA